MKTYDVILIGSGIMSTTLAANLKLLYPNLNILILEKLNQPAMESSGVMNNAGTGHAGFCELNFTPELPDGDIDISKAIHVNEAFLKSKQFWSYLIKNHGISKEFIHKVPHMSFVSGGKDISFLIRRYIRLKKSTLFDKLEFSDDHKQIKEWLPLMMVGRKDIDVAVTRYEHGADMNYEILTKELVKFCESKGVEIRYNQNVTNIKKTYPFYWEVETDDIIVHTNFLFIGAGGNSISLLEKTKIPESYGHGGFPVSGEFLVCENQDIVKQHEAKVYGKAEIGAPPMSVPHLDTRVINGKKVLLFGPYAGFSMKFLKSGSNLDLIKSITIHNIRTMLSSCFRYFGLTKYLIREVVKSDSDKFKELLKFYPNAKQEDWKKTVAGQRVQLIKRNKSGQGVIEFGTEIVTSENNTLVALLGASPGASTSVDIALQIIEKCFDLSCANNQISNYIPSHNISMDESPIKFRQIEDECNLILGLN